MRFPTTLDLLTCCRVVILTFRGPAVGYRVRRALSSSWPAQVSWSWGADPPDFTRILRISSCRRFMALCGVGRRPDRPPAGMVDAIAMDANRGRCGFRCGTSQPGLDAHLSVDGTAGP